MLETVLQLLAIGTSNGAIIALNAIGVTLVYSIVRIINFAYGDVFSLMTVLVTALVVRLGLHPSMSVGGVIVGLLIILVASVAVGALTNVLVERLAFRPFRRSSRLAPLIATIGLSFMLYQTALFVRTLTNRVIPGEHRSVPGIPELSRFRIPELLPQTDLVQAIGLDLNVIYQAKDALLLLVAVLAALLTALFLRGTRLGRALRACAHDPEMAQLCGINRNRAIVLVFAIGGGLAGLAALAHGLYYTHPSTQYGVQSGLIAFAAAVLGGIGRPIGALVSGLLLGVVAAFSDYYLAAQWTPVLLLAVLVLLLMLRPAGLSTDDAAGESLLIIRRIQATNWQRWITPLLFGGLLVYPLIARIFGFGQPIGLTNMLIYALLALGLNIVLGYGGLLDLGFAAYFGVGAYTTGLLTRHYGIFAHLGAGPRDFGLLLVASAAVAALLGVINSLITRRMHGEYLAIVTLAVGLMLPRVFLNMYSITNGSSGISAVPAPHLFGVPLQQPLAQFGLALTLVALAAIICLRLARSRIGRAWAAISADETAAESCGVSTFRGRMLAFGIGAALAGVAGALYASTWSFVYPDLAAFRVTALVLAMVVIGGSGSVAGTIVGAVLVIMYDQIMIPQLGAWLGKLGETGLLSTILDLRDINFLAFGLALYLTTLLRARPPHWRWLHLRRRAEAVEAPQASGP